MAWTKHCYVARDDLLFHAMHGGGQVYRELCGPFESVEVCKNFRDGTVEIGWDFLIDFH